MAFDSDNGIMTEPPILSSDSQLEASDQISKDRNTDTVNFQKQFNEDVLPEASLGHGDIAQGEPNKLSNQDQQKVAAKEEMRRQKKNGRAEQINQSLGPANAVKSLMNRKKIQQLSKEEKELQKKKKEILEKEKEVARAFKKKNDELRILKGKVLFKVIRMIIEILSAVGIVALIPELISLFNNDASLKKANADIKNLKSELDKTKNEKQGIEKEILNKNTEIYNLQNIIKQEGQPA